MNYFFKFMFIDESARGACAAWLQAATTAFGNIARGQAKLIDAEALMEELNTALPLTLNPSTAAASNQLMALGTMTDEAVKKIYMDAKSLCDNPDVDEVGEDGDRRKHITRAEREGMAMRKVDAEEGQ